MIFSFHSINNLSARTKDMESPLGTIIPSLTAAAFVVLFSLVNVAHSTHCI